jgi:hypothetical protein
MSKRRRARQRQRRFVARATPTTLEREERVEREPLERRRELRTRSPRGGTLSRATGTPSNALLKAGAVEYGYVMKDLRRMAVVSALLLVLLAAATFVVNTLPG